MHPFVEMADLGHEQVVFCREPHVGLRAIIAVHNTTLGPALGGCRLYNYASESDALHDVLRLSRGMTYKAAVAGLDLGGGKAVILGDKSIKSEGLFRAFGRFVHSLNGRYITAEDMNTSVEDMNLVRRETPHVTGVSTFSGGSGDPSPVTAWGVFHGIRASLDTVFGSPDVQGRTVAIQGVGNVGYHLARYLHERGAKLLYTDINTNALNRVVSEFGGTVLEEEQLFASKCDVLAPCAIGGVINPSTLSVIQAPIVAGGANNVLEDEVREGQQLIAQNITYAPDYVINAGGLMNVHAEIHGHPPEKAMNDAAGIFHTVKAVLTRARSEGIPTIEASNRLAEERIEMAARLRRIRC